MRCNQYEMIVECETFNDKLRRELHLIPPHLRKYFRLLIKQYQVVEVTQDPPDYQDDLIVRKHPFIITYKHFGGEIEFKEKLEL